ncbi:MAG: YigZ family protein [Coprococcus sp.]|nr:YigZ family protein [Coprococcus sp.]
MIEEYNTIMKHGQDEIIEKKSRFIGYAIPVTSEEEAYQYVEKIKKQHYDARHNCFAFAIGKENTLLRFSDDGEPQGTAGKPILEVITGNKVVDILIVVTRYFGGTLLGTGGLVRAYTEAAKLALGNAGIHKMQLMKTVDITVNYNDSGKVQYLIANSEAMVDDTLYTDEVCFKIGIPASSYQRLCKQIVEATSARAKLEETGEEYR